ncbi:MAG: hypothetical protein QNJ41_29890, partial [Xenococcaceae cyanobacterium MO_188.B32]|nr:hypothetical protein [Xenococcaceae cyanobacterium MO_188.B32]
AHSLASFADAGGEGELLKGLNSESESRFNWLLSSPSRARQNDFLLRQTFYADTESPTETISYLQPHMSDFQGTC